MQLLPRLVETLHDDRSMQSGDSLSFHYSMDTEQRLSNLQQGLRLMIDRCRRSQPPLRATSTPAPGCTSRQRPWGGKAPHASSQVSATQSVL